MFRCDSRVDHVFVFLSQHVFSSLIPPNLGARNLGLPNGSKDILFPQPRSPLTDQPQGRGQGLMTVVVRYLELITTLSHSLGGSNSLGFSLSLDFFLTKRERIYIYIYMLIYLSRRNALSITLVYQPPGKETC